MTEISLEQAQEIAANLAKQNAEYKELVERMERAKALDILGGKSDASIPQPEISEEERKRLETIEFFKGSDIENALRKYGK